MTKRPTLRDRLRDDDLRGWVAMIPVAAVVLAAWAILTATGMLSTPSSRTTFLLVAVLATWLLYTATYLAMTWWIFGHLDPSALHEALDPAGRREPRGISRLVAMGGHTSWATLAAWVAIFSVLAVLASPASRHTLAIPLLAAVTVAACWVLLAVTMSLAYAQHNADDAESPIELRGIDDPVLADYLTVAMMVSAGLAAPHIVITGRAASRLVRTHMVAAFVFNTVAVALLVAVILTTFSS